MIGIISIAIKATLVMVVAFGIAAVIRRRRASLRHGIFAAMLIALLALRTVPLLVPGRTL